MSPVDGGLPDADNDQEMLADAPDAHENVPDLPNDGAAVPNNGPAENNAPARTRGPVPVHEQDRRSRCRVLNNDSAASNHDPPPAITGAVGHGAVVADTGRRIVPVFSIIPRSPVDNNIEMGGLDV
ncbi:hypothetical protein PENNAL_c0025G08292 [Penicillium nalgiovense]|uniref:Uncharacterized protein n=1 Tax=Penicillium nalgiovense TaxID=60175 RepID=A0A1V6YC53_PENNA|nr:hypothetical protein PENNAL_c0025G08292 [Penicillium nalgiovense]